MNGLLRNYFTYRDVIGIIKPMKHVQLLAVASVGLALAGCAGSGSATNVVVADNIVTVPRVEAVVSRSGTPQVDAATGDLKVQDPRSFELNMEFTFQLVGYTASGARVVLSPDAWYSTDTTNSYGDLASNSGLFVTKSSINRDPLTITATYKGNLYAAEYDIRPREVLLTGRVVSETTKSPLKDVTINFYDASGAYTRSVNTAYNGRFRVSIPSGPVSLQIVSDSLPNDYYRSYMLSGFRYNAGSVDCRASIPAYEIGERDLGEDILVTPRVAGVPTPDPTGCTP